MKKLTAMKINSLAFTNKFLLDEIKDHQNKILEYMPLIINNEVNEKELLEIKAKISTLEVLVSSATNQIKLNMREIRELSKQ